MPPERSLAVFCCAASWQELLRRRFWSYEITQESALPTTARAQRPGAAESRRGLSERGGRGVEARSLSKSLLCMVVGMPPVHGTATMLSWPATGVVAQPRTATCGRITWHNVVREHHFLLGGAPGQPSQGFHCSLMSLRVSDRSRERKALILWENPSPSKMGVMVVVIVLHEGGFPHHH